MATEKRNPRSYKITDTAYRKALKKQKDPPLATFVEEVVTAIGKGKNIIIMDKTVTAKPTDPEPKFKRWDTTDNL